MSQVAQIFEEHGEELAYWHATGWVGETAVIFERHLDFQKIHETQLERARIAAATGALTMINRDLPFRDNERNPYGLDNFLYAANALGLLRCLVWVYPEPTKLSPAHLGQHLWSSLSLVPGCGKEVAESFRITAAGACASAAGLRFELTTLRRLSQVALPQGARLDLDLDYSYADDGGLTHAPAAECNSVRGFGLAAQAPRVAYSIASGFMPESFRWLWQAVAGDLGFALAVGSQSTRHADATLAVLARETTLNDAQLPSLTEAELRTLGGAGWALRALLALSANQAAEAERSYFCELQEGDRASWAAYSLGLYQMARKANGEAACWFERAERALIDTSQAHSMCLRALCELRQARFEQSQLLAERCMQELPLRKEPDRIATVAAARLNLPARLNEVRTSYSKIEAVHRLFTEA